ncbi:RE1 [Symbiodinium sp. CCMP2456]|nr:RE1 [Symbiodinium sp. CCMP2456]
MACITNLGKPLISVFLVMIKIVLLHPAGIRAQELGAVITEDSMILGVGVEGSRAGGTTPGEMVVVGVPVGSLLVMTTHEDGAKTRLGAPDPPSPVLRLAARGMAATKEFAVKAMTTQSLRLLKRMEIPGRALVEAGFPMAGDPPDSQPTFAHLDTARTMDAGDENLGQTARSYLRQIAAWRRMTRMAPETQGLTLYQHLTGKAWVEAERLSVDRLAETSGVDYLVSWVKDRYLDVEITQVGRCLSDFFRKLRRKPGQSVRDYLSDFDRCLARLNEVGCVLPDLAAAWVLVDRMALEEGAELNLLASVGNVYNLKLLKQASIVQDRSLRKPWETTATNRPWNKRQQSAMMADATGENDDHEDFQDVAIDEDCEAVPESVAAELYEAYVTHETARQKYRDTLKMRGTDPDGMREAMHQKLQAAKQRSFCSACKRRGHWHRDPQCPLNQGKGGNGSGGSSSAATSGTSSTTSSLEKNPKVNFPCHVVHVTWDLAQPAEASNLLGITDTACSKSVAGMPWVETYLNEAKKVGFRPPFLEARESFKFGASRIFEALYSIILTFEVGGHPVVVRVSVVNGDVPLLLSRPVLGKLGMIMDVQRNKADFRELQVHDLQLVITDTGHPAVPIRPIYVEPALAQGGDWEGTLSPRTSQEAPEDPNMRAYVSPKVNIERPIFYPKKKTLWELTKEELIAEAQARGLQFHPKWTLGEIRQVIQEDREAKTGSTSTGAPPPALSKMTLAQLKDAVQEAGLAAPERPNKASLMRVLRDNGGLGAQTILSFGRFRGYMYQETPPSYRIWAMNETEANAGAQEDLKMYATWCRQDQAAQSPPPTRPSLSGYVDAEDTATVPYTPDPFETWDIVGSQPRDPEGSTVERIIGGWDGPGSRPGRDRGDPAAGTTPGFAPRPQRTTAEDAMKEDTDNAKPDQDEIFHECEEEASVTKGDISEDANTKEQNPAKYTQDPSFGNFYKEIPKEQNPAKYTQDPNFGDFYKEIPYGQNHEFKEYEKGLDYSTGAREQNPAKYRQDPRGHGVQSREQNPAKYRQDPRGHGVQTRSQDDSGRVLGDLDLCGIEDEYEAACIGADISAGDGDKAVHESMSTYVYGAEGRNDGKACENLAKEFFKDKRFNYKDLTQILEVLPMKSTRRHRGACGYDTEEVKSFLGGMWTHGGFWGESLQTKAFPWTVKYINKAMRELSGDAWGKTPPMWTSLIITKNVKMRVHKDAHNIPGSSVLTLTLGNFSGGNLWLESSPGDGNGETAIYDDHGQEIAGISISTKERPYVFDPKKKHATEQWEGDRWCISCFATRGASRASQDERDSLRALCFPLRGLDSLLTTKPDDYVKAERPAKSTRKGMWKAAKRLVALTSVCTAAATTYTTEILPAPRGKDAVALFEIGGWTKTLEAGEYDFMTAEPILPEDLYKDNFVDKLNETLKVFSPATMWIHGGIVAGRLSDIEKAASWQLKQGRAVVLEAPAEAAMWSGPEVERLCEEGSLLKEERRGGRRELRINVPQSPQPFSKDEDVEPVAAYFSSTVDARTEDALHEAYAVSRIPEGATEDRDQAQRGASAISFENGKEIPPEVRSSLKRLHQNLAHPSREDLCRHLRLAGSSPEILDAAKRLRCQVCDRHHRGKSAKPSSLPSLLEFNQLVAVDAFSVYDSQHKRVEFLMIIDLGTGFCVARELEGHSGQALEKVFCEAWATTFGPPGTLILDLETGLQAGLARFSEWHGTWIRPIAAQAHYQQGTVERCIRSWKQLWEKVCDEKTITHEEGAMAATVINSAMNSLRRSSGTSPAQAVWGREPRLPEDLSQPAEADHFESVLSRDRLRAREFALRNAARTAYYKCQSDSTLRRALNHRSRVAGPELTTGDHVFIYRKPKSQKHWEWFGPGVLIGREGPNWWVSYSGRCHLTAPEHLRLASGEEIGAAFTLRASQDDLEKLLEADFGTEDIYVDDLQEAQMIEDDDEVMIDQHEDGGQVLGAPVQGDHKRDAGDPRVPLVTKRARRKGPGEGPPPGPSDHPPGHSAHMAKFAKTARGREKALEKEIPWSLIPGEAQSLFKEAEDKQYQEHRQHGALEPMSLEESREVTRTRGDRVLPSRFAYRDKNWSKRRGDPSVPWKAKSRLVIGGHRDPDLLKGLNTHAPTISRQGILLLLQVLASNLDHGWTGHAGDVTAAFLSGETLTRELFLKQPRTGLGGLHPEQLLRIRKPIFGLVDSPAAWWQKLSSTLKETVITDDKNIKWAIRQCELDNCIFTVQEILTDENGKVTYGKPQAYLGVHVDDILLVGKNDLCECVKAELSRQFPIDEWETGSFDYVGSYIDIQPDRIKVSQESYVNTRLFTIDIERGAKDWEPASETQRLDNMSLIGALSWLASQTRPDLQVGVSMSQQCQREPCIGDLRFTNLLAQRALEHQQEGVYIYPVDFTDSILLCYHDAGWANCPQDQEDPYYALTVDEEKNGVIHGAPYGLLGRKAKKANSSIASQLGCLFVFGNRSILRGDRTKMSVLDWKSGACERVCRSTFQAETMACAYGIETSEYILKFLQTLLDGELVRGATSFSARFVSDCKSLYDHLMREGIPRVPTCKRLAIDLASIRCDLRLFGKIAWTPTEAQLADLLTKPLKAVQWWKEIKLGIKLTFREQEKILNQCKSRIES